MTQPSLYAQLRALGISKSYASEIASGGRTPSPTLALRIFRELGVKLGTLKDASSAEIKVLERVHARQATDRRTAT